MTSDQEPKNAIEMCLPAKGRRRIEALTAEQSDDFVTLVRAAGLDPKTSFRGKKLRVDFGEADLSGFDFTSADLSECNLSGAQIDGAILTGVKLEMEHLPAARNRAQELSGIISELKVVYDALDTDLTEAAVLQKSLVPNQIHRIPGGEFSTDVHSAGHIGGSMVGSFWINDDRIGIFSFGVSGSSLAAALFATRILGLFNPASIERNIAVKIGPTGIEGRDPAEIAADLNQIILSELSSRRHLSLCYVEIDHRSGDLRLVQAGYPHPLVQRSDGAISKLGAGGMTIGEKEESTWETVSDSLGIGDRLLIVNNAVINCIGIGGTELGQKRLEQMVRRNAKLRGKALIDSLKWELVRWMGRDQLDDDIAFALFEYDGLRVELKIQ